MNSWCESCARKNCCYTMEIRPRCYVATTNTASGTPESYLAKSLRYSRDNHEIAKDEPQIVKKYDTFCGVPMAEAIEVMQKYKASKDEPQSLEQFRVSLEYHTDTTHFGKTKGESLTTNKIEDEPQTDCAWMKGE